MDTVGQRLRKGEVFNRTHGPRGILNWWSTCRWWWSKVKKARKAESVEKEFQVRCLRASQGPNAKPLTELKAVRQEALKWQNLDKEPQPSNQERFRERHPSLYFFLRSYHLNSQDQAHQLNRAIRWGALEAET